MTSPGLNSRDTGTSRRQRGKPTTFNYQISLKARPVLNPRRRLREEIIPRSTTDRHQEFDCIFKDCIFEVPRSLRLLQPNAFVPHIVSIGPYHKKGKHLREMEKYKQRLLPYVTDRTEKFSTQVSLRQEISQLEKATWECYAQPIKDLESEQFVDLMLHDACFIIELLYNSAIGWENCEYKDPWGVIIPRGFLPFIQRDLLILENQLPLPVLDQMFALTWGDRSTQGKSVAKLALKFFDSVVPAGQLDLNPAAGISENPSKKARRPLHLLDIVHQLLEPTGHQPNGEEDKRGLKLDQANCKDKRNRKKDSADELIAMLSVTRLRGTGIKFEEKKGTVKFTDIEFDPNAGKLSIPQLRIRDSTQSIFLNLMAFELCYPHRSSYVTSYITFMDGLINSPKDVEYLQEKNIIVHDLGSEEDVAILFNNLRKEIVFNPKDYYLFQVSQGLKQHYDQKWNGWRATLKHEYLKDPWKIISLVAAGFLILLTVAQTVYAVVGYHRPSF